MPRSRPRLRRTAAAVAVGVLSMVAAGCTGGDSPPGQASKDDLVAQVASFDLAVGPPSRFLVGVLTHDRRFLAYGDVQFRFAYLGTKQDAAAGDYGSSVTARYLPIPGSVIPSSPPAEPQLVSGSEGRGVYVAQAGFPRAGFYQVEVGAEVAGRRRTATAAFAVNERHAVPAQGDAALATENLTASSPDAPAAAIDSRAANAGGVPDAALHRTTIAAALAAGRPAVVVFSTPVYCQSQFCGPVTDMVAELASSYADRADFIHVEIWRDFQNQVINRAAADWLLREGDLNEPWVFLIGADGKIAARFDNVATAAELRPLLEKLPVIGPGT